MFGHEQGGGWEGSAKPEHKAAMATQQVNARCQTMKEAAVMCVIDPPPALGEWEVDEIYIVSSKPENIHRSGHSLPSAKTNPVYLFDANKKKANSIKSRIPNVDSQQFP